MTKPSSSLAQLFSTLKAQATPRVQYGLVLLLLLLALIGVRELSTSLSEARLVAGRTAADLALLSDDLAEPTWAQRAEDAAAARNEWERHVWTAASEGIAAASLELDLRNTAQSAGVKRPQLTVTADVIKRGEISFLRFSLSGEMEEGTPHLLLAKLGTSRPALFVSDLQLVQQRTGRYSLQLEGLAPFELQQELN